MFKISISLSLREQTKYEAKENCFFKKLPNHSGLLSSHKINALPLETTEMHLEATMLSETSPVKKDKFLSHATSLIGRT